MDSGHLWYLSSYMSVHSGVGSQEGEFTFMNWLGGEDFEHYSSRQGAALYNGREDWIHYEFSKNTPLNRASFLSIVDLGGFRVSHQV